MSPLSDRNPAASPNPFLPEADFDSVPIVDFSGMLQGSASEKSRVAEALRDACMRVGFFYLVNHGIPQDRIDSTFAEAHRFFALPVERKMRWHMAQSAHFCGYVPLLEDRGDLKEAFDFAAEDTRVGQHILHGDYRQAGNIWPDDLPDFRDNLSRYAVGIRMLSRQLFGAFALALELPEDYFAQMTDKPVSMMRILHYPVQVDPVKEARVGVRAHTDHECFSILCQDEVTALQVRNRRGQWIAVPPVANSFVVNIGDQMARWTNDLFASTPHRVINVSGRERYSIPFFVGANHDAIVEALPSCIGPDNPAKYPPIVSGEYVSRLIQQGYQSPSPFHPSAA
jgi:isopenicillin N synthase-like dioxygenase